jgi:16S rRNA (uracil1498-N3)-methyltransferase
LKPGDIVELLDNLGSAFAASITAIDRDRTTLRIEGPVETMPEPAAQITVAQALGKADKFEQVVQHGTEIGAAVFVPVRAERCVVSVDSSPNRTASRRARWTQIAREAAQQCGRCRIPAVTAPVRALELFRQAESASDADLPDSLCSGAELRLLLHTDLEAATIRNVLNSLTERPGTVAIAIGPEGGWSPDEVIAARESGWLEVSLGSYVLRTETAALVAISRIMHCFEE